MKIYGIYENNKTEQCVYVGTLKEIAEEFGIKRHSLDRILSRGDKTIQGNRHQRYLIVFVYNEKGAKDDICIRNKRKGGGKTKTTL